MKTIDIQEATAPLSDYIAMAIPEPMLITRYGKPFMALVDVEDFDEETLSLNMNREFIEIIQQSRQRHQREGGISSEEMRRRLESLE